MKSKPVEKWEKEYMKRFGNFITSALWYNAVKAFIYETLAVQKKELEAYKGKLKREWYQEGYKDGRNMAEASYTAAEKSNEAQREVEDKYYDTNVYKLLKQVEQKVKEKTKRESLEFLDKWIPRGSYLRNRFDQVSQKS